MHHYQVLIIGGGPSGAGCALALRDGGLRVALADRAVFPRDKICGDAIPGPTFTGLDRIDPALGERLRHFAAGHRVTATRGVAPNGRSLRLDWSTFSFNCPRLAFDDFLLGLVRTETDTEVLEGHQLRTVDRGAGGWHCRFADGTACTADLVIGCDGAASTVARELLPAAARVPKGDIAVRAYYRGVAGTEAGTNEIHFLRDLPLGYFWIFPLADGIVNVGLGVTQDRRRPAVTNLPAALRELLATSPTLAPRFAAATSLDRVRGFALPFCRERRPVAGAGFMLCGDAAGLIDPLWGHGIHTGLESGRLAARQAVACHAAGDFSAARMADYDAAVHTTISRDFLRAHRALRVVRRYPALLRPFWGLLRYPDLTRRLLRGSGVV